MTHGLTLTQPWASLVVSGEKRVETRDWPAPCRGLVAIHASKSWKPDDRAKLLVPEFVASLAVAGIRGEDDMPLGVVLGVVEVVKCAVIDDALVARLTPKERMFGGYANGRWAWALRGARALLRPIQMRGDRGVFGLPAEVQLMLEEFVLFREVQARVPFVSDPGEVAREDFEERAGIVEFDGGLSRADAEAAARGRA